MNKSLHNPYGETTMFDTIQNRVLFAFVGATAIVALLATIY